MIDLNKLKSKDKTQVEYIGARVATETKETLEKIIAAEGIKSVSALIDALVIEFIEKWQAKQKTKTDKAG